MQADIFKCVKCGAQMEGMHCNTCGFEPEKIADGIYNFMPARGKGLTDMKIIDALVGNYEKNVYIDWMMSVVNRVLKNEQGLFLDIGSGPGFYSRKITENNPAVSFIDLDINPSFKPSFVSERLMYVQADLFNNPFLNGAFDGVVSFDVIEHIEDDEKFIRTAVKLLKRGGVFIIGTPNKTRLTALLKELITGKRKFPYSYGVNDVVGEVTHIREYEYRDLVDIFSKFSGEIEYSIRPFFLGIRGIRKLIGIKEPGILGNISSYWLVTGKKGLNLLDLKKEYWYNIF